MRIIGKNISFTFLQSFLFCGLVFWHFSIVSEEYPESIESIESIEPMQPIESDKQSANYPANYPPPEPSFLCIDTPFNMETGEFDPANPALCPTGDRHVNKTLPAGFQNKEGSLVDGKGKGRGSGSSDDDGYGGETQSPGGESLSDWVERQRQEREFNDNMYRQLEQDYRNYQRYLYEKHLRERYLFDVITQVIKTVKYSVGAPFIDELHQEFFTSDAEINQEWLNKINIKAKQIYPQVYQIMMDKYKEVGDLIEGISLADIIQDATTVIKYQVATKVVDFKIKYLTKQKMRELGRLFVAQGSGTKIHQTSWIEQANTIINQVEDILNTDLYKKLHLDDKEYVAKDIKILEHAKEIEEILHNAAYKLAVKHVFNPTQNKGERAMYTSLTRKTAIKEIREKYIQSGKQLTNQQIKYWYHIGSKNIELDQVLDLTDANTLKNLSKNLDSPLTQKTIAKKEKTYKEAYKFTHIIGHIAKRKGIRGIKAPSAYGGNNVVIFRGLNK